MGPDHRKKRSKLNSSHLISALLCYIKGMETEFPAESPPELEIDPKKVKSLRARALRLKKLFNLTLEEYDLILKFQGGVCAICKKPPKEGKNLAVDHLHKDLPPGIEGGIVQGGGIRGLLCFRCNLLLNKLSDNPRIAKGAFDYLKNPPATSALGCPRYGLKGRVTNKKKTRLRLNKK
jgi:hypothetical protein